MEDAAGLLMLAVGVCAIAVALGATFSTRRGRKAMMAAGRILETLLPPW